MEGLMKALYNAIGVGALLVTLAIGWSQYEAYRHREVVDIYQCPDPTGQFFDCDWWPRKQ